MDGEELRDGLADLIRKDHPVHMHSDFCKAWKAEHENCSGCEAEVGCSKLVALMGVMMMPTLYEPKGFEDFQKMHRRMEELQGLIFKAKAAEEVKAIPWN